MQSGAFRYVPALDGVRALAVALVFVFHAAPDVLPGGYAGVDVFFVLSGFLITTLLAQELQANGHVNLPKFYGRRGVRLWPALIITLVIAVPVSLKIDAAGLVGDEVAGVLYLSDFWALHDGPHVAALGQLWSLAVEEQFYLVWPLVLTWLMRRRRADAWRWLLAAAVALTVVKAVGYELMGWEDVYFTPLGSADQLVLGAALALMLSSGIAVGAFASPRCGGLGAVVVLLGAGALNEVQDPVAYRGGMFVIALGAAALIGHLVLAGPTSWISRVYALGPVRWVGQRSYGIYLYHLAALALTQQIHTRRGMQLLLALVLTAILSGLSFHVVERPISRRLRPRLQAAMSTRTASST